MDEQPAAGIDRRGPMLFLGAVGLALVVLLVLAVTGVFGGQDTDEEDWRAAVERQGGPVADWDSYRDTWVEQICADDDETFAWVVVAAVDRGAPFERIETNVRYACPDREDVLAMLRPALTEVAEACDGRRRPRTEKQQQLAQALGCAQRSGRSGAGRAR